jgi:protein-disulfide isomerase
VALGVIVIAFVVLSNNQPTPTPQASGSFSLVAPFTTYPAENADGTMGAATAPLTISEFADYQCPSCKSYARLVEPGLIDEYVRPGKARLVFHDFAFLGAESTEAATAAQCAGEQQRFWPYHGYLYANQGVKENGGTFSDAFLRAVGQAVGLDMAKFDACRAGTAARQRVITSTTAAQNLGVDSTPTIVVNSLSPIVGVPGWADFKAYLDAILAGG